MKQCISKSALVAEIERMLQKEYPCDNSEQEAGYDFALYELQEYLDTLEVKEVDFEKIWKEYFKYRGDVATVNVKSLAKHFFELGLKARKGE